MKHANIQPKDLSWPYWPVVPLYPYGKRRTLRQEILKDTIWTFDQLQGILYVTVPIRMTVIRLEKGGLLVYAPIAPTGECIHLVQELVENYGDVKYIILPTVTGIEHKVFVGPFARRFPTAQVFVAPDQWSFPLDLPLSWLGLPLGRTKPLPNSCDTYNLPFSDDFNYAVLGPIKLGIGPFEEVALFHKRSRTLLLTDTLVAVPEDPPPVFNLDPYPLLFHARENVSEPMQDTPANRRKGWQRISLFALFFRPTALDVFTLRELWQNRNKAVDRSKPAYFGLLPWQWKDTWQQSFQALRGNGRPFVAPILQTLIFDPRPQDVLTWVDIVTRWRFQQIIPCHFDTLLNVNPGQFQQAFDFLGQYGQRSIGLSTWLTKNPPLPEADFALLNRLRAILDKLGVTA